MIPFGLLRIGLFALDAETAHGLTIDALKLGLTPPAKRHDDPRLAVKALGLTFPNPIGMAAGFDKNAEVPDALIALGFGFAEVGTITPKAQSGNPRPRVFRLVADKGVINRLGFNNAGHAPAYQRLLARKGAAGIVGVNVGANKDATDRIADYVAGIDTFADVASYFTVNISSPNTPGLRDLQARASLDELLARVIEAREAAVERAGRRVPVLLKIAPDLDEAGLDDACDVALARGVDGLIVSNTTLARDGLSDPRIAREAGGLSGRPLFRRSTIMLARVRRRVGPEPVLIGVGGVDSGEAALAKIEAGADLVQLYTGLVYEGPELIGRITRHLSERAAAMGLASIAEARDRKTAFWADETP